MEGIGPVNEICLDASLNDLDIVREDFGITNGEDKIMEVVRNLYQAI